MLIDIDKGEFHYYVENLKNVKLKVWELPDKRKVTHYLKDGRLVGRKIWSPNIGEDVCQVNKIDWR